MIETHELVVPKSIPIILPILVPPFYLTTSSYMNFLFTERRSLPIEDAACGKADKARFIKSQGDFITQGKIISFFIKVIT